MAKAEAYQDDLCSETGPTGTPDTPTVHVSMGFTFLWFWYDSMVRMPSFIWYALGVLLGSEHFLV